MLKQTPIYRPKAPSLVDAEWLLAAAVTLPGARLADHSHRGKVLIQGADASVLLSRLWKLPALPPAAGARIPQGYAFCLRPGRYFLSLRPGAEETALAALNSLPADSSLTFTDLTHGRSELWLLGPGAAAILGHLCGLDFHPTIFSDLVAKESSVARTHQLILRHDQDGQPTYALVGPRSLGAYLWDAMVEIGAQEAESEDRSLSPPYHE